MCYIIALKNRIFLGWLENKKNTILSSLLLCYEPDISLAECKFSRVHLVVDRYISSIWNMESDTATKFKSLRRIRGSECHTRRRRDDVPAADYRIIAAIEPILILGNTEGHEQC